MYLKFCRQFWDLIECFELLICQFRLSINIEIKVFSTNFGIEHFLAPQDYESLGGVIFMALTCNYGDELLLLGSASILDVKVGTLGICISLMYLNAYTVN